MLAFEFLPARHGDCFLVRWGDPERIMVVDGGPDEVYERVLSFTVSQISPLRTCWQCFLTARASRQVLGEGDDQASAHGGDRIWNVALGPQRRRRGIGNRRERQVLRTAWRDEVLRGESSPARRPRSRKSRCTSWRDGGSRAIRGLRNVRARPPA